MAIGELETAKKRCESVIRTIEKLPLSSSSTSSCRHTLLKLASSELSFLSSIVADPPPQSLSVNIESIVRILRLPSITGVSRVCKTLRFPIGDVHIDLVCTIENAPVWIIVSDRNPSYISWNDSDRHGSKGLRSRIQHVLAAAQSTTTLRPSSVILFFANGLRSTVYEKLRDEFGAVDFDFGLDSDFEKQWMEIGLMSLQRDRIKKQFLLRSSLWINVIRLPLMNMRLYPKQRLWK